MNKTILSVLLSCGAFALAQAPAPAPAPANQLSPAVLAQMLRSAATFHELVENMNLNKALGTDVHVQGPNGVPQHSLERTAQTIGAGAGAGAAIGAMTKSQNGVMIGALIGGAGGLIIDQILKHNEEAKAAAAAYAPAPNSAAPVPQPRPYPQQLQERHQ